MKSVIHWIGARMGPTVGLEAVAKIEILDFDFKKKFHTKGTGDRS
jgi:hypothetical protein